jgi:hypothetical protein
MSVCMGVRVYECMNVPGGGLGSSPSSRRIISFHVCHDCSFCSVSLTCLKKSSELVFIRWLFIMLWTFFAPPSLKSRPTPSLIASSCRASSMPNAIRSRHRAVAPQLLSALTTGSAARSCIVCIVYIECILVCIVCIVCIGGRVYIVCIVCIVCIACIVCIVCIVCIPSLYSHGLSSQLIRCSRRSAIDCHCTVLVSPPV